MSPAWNTWEHLLVACLIVYCWSDMGPSPRLFPCRLCDPCPSFWLQEKQVVPGWDNCQALGKITYTSVSFPRQGIPCSQVRSTDGGQRVHCCAVTVLRSVLQHFTAAWDHQGGLWKPMKQIRWTAPNFLGGSNFGAMLTTHTWEPFFAARQCGQAEQCSRMDCVGPIGMPQLKHIQWRERDSQLSRRAEKVRSDPATALTRNLTDCVHFKLRNSSFSYFSFTNARQCFCHISYIRFLSFTHFASE